MLLMLCGFRKLIVSLSLQLISHILFIKGIWKFTGESTGTPVLGSVTAPCKHLNALIVVSLRQDLSEMHVKILRVLLSFPLFLQLVGCTEPRRLRNKVLCDQGKTRWVIILQKPDTLIDGQRWVEAVRSHVEYQPQSHMMIIGNTYLPFHFNDVPSLQEWPRFKEVVIFVSTNFFPLCRS